MDIIEKNNEYNRIKESNENITYMPITKGGKTTEYAPVSERVKAFRFIHPCGAISSKIINESFDAVTIKAEVFDDEGHLLATGYASETRDTGIVNKTSMLENAETSAVGRALGFLGIGVKNGIATAEEMDKAAKIKDERDHFKRCQMCGGIINDAQNSKGVLYKADDIAKGSLSTYGMVLCMSCMLNLSKVKTPFDMRTEAET